MIVGHPAILRALERAARVFADELQVQLAASAAPPAGAPAEPYSQDRPPPGVTRRLYLTAAGRGDFPTSKIGRLVMCSAEDWNTYAASRRKVAQKRTAATPANDTAPPMPKAPAEMSDRELLERAGVPLRAVARKG